MDLEEFETYPWGRLVFKWLINSVKRKDFTKTYTIDGFAQVLQVWIYFALPDFAAVFGKPIRNKSSPPFLAYKGHKGRKFVKEDSRNEMFPQRDNDVGDVAVENLLPFNEERRAPKKARTVAYTESLPSDDHIEPPPESSAARNGLTRVEIEQMFKEMTNDCWTRIRLSVNQEFLDLSESVNGDKRERENTEPDGMKEPSVVIMDKTKPTNSDLKKEEERRFEKKMMLLKNIFVKKVNEKGSLPRHSNLLLVSTKKFVHGYDPFAPVEKVLLDFLKKIHKS
ncbi:uncharacterized protein LOC108845120 [Raphanus sativus]|uniref:Uncharacterized protein LOC108845120 n=1 Tax=Raphanus sativus TaxID=3726 RepID=A0A9W3DEH5_RAPSA|nr:uncharacterized protein LOC108845120 [Raphanus sativus]